MAFGFDPLAVVPEDLFLIDNGSWPYGEHCAAGHEGTLCGQCQSGYGKGVSGDCAICSGTAVDILVIAAAVIVLLAVLIFLVYNAMVSQGRRSKHAAFAKILVSYVQVLGLARNFPLQWPKPLPELYSVESATTSVGTDFISAECIFGQDAYDADHDFLTSALFRQVSCVCFVLCPRH